VPALGDYDDGQIGGMVTKSKYFNMWKVFLMEVNPFIPLIMGV
jgi:hypothetical protein